MTRSRALKRLQVIVGKTEYLENVMSIKTDDDRKAQEYLGEAKELLIKALYKLGY